MIFDKRKRTLNKNELEVLHHILTIFYDRTKPKTTDLDDARYLRMKVKEVLDNLK